MHYRDDEEWLDSRNHFCGDLTNREYQRLFEKDKKGCMDLVSRYITRMVLLDMGAKRVPRHRYNRRDPLRP